MAEPGGAHAPDTAEQTEESIHAWWASVLTGEAHAPHPLYGQDVSARLDGETLVISGRVETEAEKQAVTDEASALRGRGVVAIQNDLRVDPEEQEEPGVLTQSLLGVFKNAALAGVARDYLDDRLRIPPRLKRVIHGADAEADVRALLPEAYWDEADKALAEGNALVVFTVDETEAFRARELLEEETASMEMYVLPPERARRAPRQGRSPS
jgi:hypothetical protein